LFGIASVSPRRESHVPTKTKTPYLIHLAAWRRAGSLRTASALAEKHANTIMK